MDRFMDPIDQSDALAPVDLVMTARDASLGFWQDEADEWDRLPSLAAILARLED